MKNVMASSALAIALALLLVTGCRGQVQPTSSPKASLTWTVPAASGTWTGCTTSAPCTYLVYRETVASAGTACDASTSANYKQVGTSTTNAYTDAAVTQGGYFCWVVQTSQGTPALYSDPSSPSNSGAALAVPAVPSAPGTPTATEQTASAEAPQVRPALPSVQVATLHAPVSLVVHARMTR